MEFSDILKWVFVEFWGRIIVAAITALGLWPFTTAPKGKPLPIRLKIIYGLGVFALTLFILNQVNYSLLESKALGILQPGGEKITQWLSDVGISVAKVPDDQAEFRLEMRTASGVTFYISHDKATPNILTFAAVIQGNDAQKKRLKIMSVEERQKVIATVRTTLDTWALAGHQGKINQDLMSISLQDTMVYDEPITKRELIGTVKRFVSAMTMTMTTINILVSPIDAKTP